MKTRWGIWTAVLLVGAFASGATAQQEQWLRYATSDQLYEAVGSTWGQSAVPTDKAPEGLALPAFKSDKPVFILWKVKLDKPPERVAKDGGVWLALDQSRKGGPYDLLYADAKVKGSLAEAQPIKAADVQDSFSQGGSLSVSFRQVQFLLPGPDGPCAYHLSVQYRQRPVQYLNRVMASAPGVDRSAYLHAAGWYEGDVTVDGRKLHCVLLDNNANGRFDDSDANSSQCDRIRLAPPGDTSFRDWSTDTTTRFLGKYVQVSEKLIPVKVAPDGASVTFGKAETPATGTVRLPAAVDKFSAFGPVGHLNLEPKDGKVQLPAGVYRIARWQITRKDAGGALWQVRENNCTGEPAFTAAEGKEIALDFAEPLRWAVSVSKGADGYQINQGVRTRKGDYVTLLRDGKQPAEPTVRIVSADGAYNRTFNLAYG